jgi:hypothetical protein
VSAWFTQSSMSVRMFLTMIPCQGIPDVHPPLLSAYSQDVHRNVSDSGLTLAP